LKFDISFIPATKKDDSSTFDGRPFLLYSIPDDRERIIPNKWLILEVRELLVSFPFSTASGNTKFCNFHFS